MVSRVARLEQLRKVPLFAECSSDQLAAIADVGTEVVAAKGQRLVEEGRYGKECFILLAGDVDVTRQGVLINRLGPGEAFGELSLLYRGPRSATVTATSDLELVRIERSDFVALVESIPPLATHLLAVMAKRLVDRDPDLGL